MKNYLFLVLSLLFLLSSCGKTVKEQRPQDILPRRKMVEVIIDIQILEAAFAQKNLPRDTAIFLYRNYEKDIFRKHKISDTIYHKSFDYYSKNPLLMDEIYEKVIDSLSLREGQGRL